MADDEWPLPLVQGQHHSERFRVQTGGAPQSLAGRELRAQVRTKAGGDLLLDLTPMLTLEPSGATGVIELFIPARATRALPRGGVWDLYLSDPGSNDDRGERLCRGPVTLEKAVTSG